MPVLRESQILIELDQNRKGLKVASSAALDGKRRIVIQCYFDPVNTGQGWGYLITHSPRYPLDLECPIGVRRSNYKYGKNLPKKYLKVAKELESTLRQLY
jgi:hypothetical protein